MGIRPDSPLGLAILGAVFAGLGVFRLVNADRVGWLLVGASVLLFVGAWWKIGKPPEPPEE